MYGSRAVSTYQGHCHQLDSEAVHTDKYFGIYDT